MNFKQSQLKIGSIKSAVGAATGVIIGEAATGALATLHGFYHVLIVIGTTILICEARFWNQWANSSETPTLIQQDLQTAATASKDTSTAIAAAQSSQQDKKP